MELKEVRGPKGFLKYFFQDFKLSQQGKNPPSPPSANTEDPSSAFAKQGDYEFNSRVADLLVIPFCSPLSISRCQHLHDSAEHFHMKGLTAIGITSLFPHKAHLIRINVLEVLLRIDRNGWMLRKLWVLDSSVLVTELHGRRAASRRHRSRCIDVHLIHVDVIHDYLEPGAQRYSMYWASSC